MPLSRSPPRTSETTTHGPEPSNSRSGTGLNVATASDKDSSASETAAAAGRKRKRSEEGVRELKMELLAMFSNWTSEQDKKFSTLLNTIIEIKDQNKEIRKSIDFMSAQYDDLIKRIEKLEVEKTNNHKMIQNLETRIEQIERSNYTYCLELRNVPLKHSETKKDLTSLAQNVGKALNVPVQKSDIRDIYRLKSEKNKSIIVELNSVLLKDELLKSLKAYNRGSKDKFSTLSLLIEGPPSPVYISERLTYQARKLFAMSRKFASAQNYRFCWTAYGKIYLRKKEGDPAVRVTSEKDLEKLNQI